MNFDITHLFVVALAHFNVFSASADHVNESEDLLSI